MIISDLDRGFERFAAAGGGDFGRAIDTQKAGVNASGYSVPVHAIDFELLHNQIGGIANDDTIGRRIEIDHVPWTRRTAGKTFALADGEQLDAVMLPDEISTNVVNFTAMKFIFA